MATSTAQQLARACPEISIDPDVVSRASGEILVRLEEDGFDTSTGELGMEDASADILARQEAFLAKHDLADGASPELVCAAARVEMAEGTQIGGYLVEVAQ